MTLLSTLAGLASCAAPQGGAGAATVAPLPAGADPSARAGATVFASQCVACHGPHGKGDGPAARKMHADMPDLAEAAATSGDDELFKVVTNGFKPMPSFRDRLSEGAPLADLRTLAHSTGMRSLRADALEKAKSGLTTLAEVFRVTT